MFVVLLGIMGLTQKPRFRTSKPCQGLISLQNGFWVTLIFSFICMYSCGGVEVKGLKLELILFVLLLNLPLFVEYRRQGGHNAPTALNLFLGFLDDAVHELKVQFAHPGRATLWSVGQAAIEIKGCSNGYLHSVLEVWLQALHELFLLWCAKGYPNNVGTVLLNHAGNAGVVELIDSAEGEFLECHAGNVGVLLGKILLQGVEDVLLCAKENHAVLALTHNVYEYVAAAVVATLATVYPFDELWHPTAVAD